MLFRSDGALQAHPGGRRGDVHGQAEPSIRTGQQTDLFHEGAASGVGLDRDACLAFGAAALLRMPTRLRISWEDEQTLKIETDAGQQTRLFHFAGDISVPAQRSWQGYSTAAWTRPVGGFDLRTVFGAPGAGGDGPPRGALKVETRNVRAGYLRKNGVPYSESAQLTEYLSRISAVGNDYLTVLSVVHDPTYLTTDFITSSQFKREPDASNWNPSPCGTAPPRSSAGD